MTTLTQLNLSHNAVVDLNQISGLLNLSKLDISSNPVTTLAPMAECTNLTDLIADDAQLTSLEGLENMKMLRLCVIRSSKFSPVYLLPTQPL